jgi:prepilin peptidase CpaA
MTVEFVLIMMVLPALLIAAGVWDLASFTIPNGIQIALIAGFAVFVFATHMSSGTFGGHLLAGFLGLVIGFSLFALGYVGGGDAKLFACVCLWFGMHDLLLYALVASIFGGVLTLMLLTMRQLPLPAVLSGQGWLLRLHDARQGIPYGVALASGAFCILPQADIFRAAFGV